MSHSNHFSAMTEAERELAIKQLIYWASLSPSDEELMAMEDDVRAAYVDTIGVRARWTLQDLTAAIAALPPEARDFLTSLGRDR